MELNEIKDKLQLVEEALSYVEGIKQDAEDLEYLADDAASYANQLYETASNVSPKVDEAIGQLEYARDVYKRQGEQCCYSKLTLA